MAEFNFHSEPLEKLCETFKTNIKTGLTSDQASAGNTLYGANTLTPPPSTPEWKKIWSCLLSGPSVPLWLGAVPCFVAYSKGFGINNLYLGAGLSSIVTVTGLYSYHQLSKLNNDMESVKALNHEYVVCIRSGEKQHVKREDLTLGDIVQISRGDIVPADIRILESSGLKVDNSKLTRESQLHKGHIADPVRQEMDKCRVCAQPRSPKFTHSDHLKTENIAFYSTLVVEGSGVGMVVRIGDETVVAKDAHISSDLLYHKHSIIKEVNRYFFLVSGVSVSLCVVLANASHIKNSRWLYPIMFGLCLIPPGMYASYNAALRNAYFQLAAFNILVKDVDGLATLGAISSMYTSMTGNITQNKMTVNHIWVNNEIMLADLSDGNEWSMAKDASWKILERAAVLCNNAEFMDGQEGVPTLKKEVLGNTTDAAIFKVTEVATGGNVMVYREKHAKVFEIAFNSERKCQLSIHQLDNTNNGGCLVVMKGAPEKILKLCTSVFIDDMEIPINKQIKSNIETSINELARHGERVIGFCDKILPEDSEKILAEFKSSNNNAEDLYTFLKSNPILKGFRFLGLISLIDAPRAAVSNAIYKLKHGNYFGSSEIKVVMVTGEHPITAKAIALRIGILNEDTKEDIAERKGIDISEQNPYEARAAIVHGEDARKMSEDQIREILFNHEEIIFARTDPQTKRNIIIAAKHLGEVVAVVGGDLNDTPAVEVADIGIAMGISGAECTKNSADIILLDDNFSSIFRGLEETENILKRMKKFPFFKVPIECGTETEISDAERQYRSSCISSSNVNF